MKYYFGQYINEKSVSYIVKNPSRNEHSSSFEFSAEIVYNFHNPNIVRELFHASELKELESHEVIKYKLLGFIK